MITTDYDTCVIDCERCAGEGRDITGYGDGEVDHGRCSVCDGRAEVEIETAPDDAGRPG